MTQLKMTILQQMTAPEPLSAKQISKCKDGREAILLCIQSRRVKFSYAELSSLLNIDKGHWTRILQRKAHFPSEKRPDLMRLCGNLAPLQFEAKELGYGQMFDLMNRVRKTA